MCPCYEKRDVPTATNRVRTLPCRNEADDVRSARGGVDDRCTDSSEDMTRDISAVILTHNDADELRELLPSLGWCDAVILVDSKSTDSTRALAEAHGADVVDAPKAGPGEPFDHFRQRGVERADTRWILRLDADERIPDTLRDRLLDHTRRAEAEDILEAPRTNYLDGRPLEASNKWPDYVPVLFRRDAITFGETPHLFAEYRSEDVRQLPAERRLAVQHDFADSLLDHFRNQRRYAAIAGNQRQPKRHHFINPFTGFVSRMTTHEAWRDGIAGWGIALCWAWFHAEATVRSLLNDAETSAPENEI